MKDMRLKVVVLVAAGAASLVPLLAYSWAKAEGSAETEQQIRRLEEERRQAVLHNDTKALDRLYADDMTTIDIRGIFHSNSNKASVNLNAKGTRTTTSWVADEMTVRAYGDTAVVTQRAQITDVIGDESRSFSARLTHVWVKLQGQWRLAARHATRISEPPQSTTGVTTSQLDRPSSSLPHSFSGPSPFSEAEMEINRIREQSRRAFLEGDYDTLDRLWADDFFSTTSWGEIRTKAESLQGLRKGERKFLSLDYDDIKVRICGDAAVETGRVTYRVLSGGQEIPGNARYTLVFIEQPVGWRLVSHQVTNIAQPPAASNAAPADAASGKVVEQEVINLMSRLEEAHRHADAAFFEHVYASDFSAITPSGELASRAEVLQAWKSGAVKYDSYEYDDVHVRVYEETAVVTNRSTRKGHINARDATGQFRQTRVFVKRQGQWQMVTSQVTRISVQSQDTEANKALVRRYIEATNTRGHGDEAVLNEFIAPDFVRHGGKELRGIASFRQNGARVQAAYPDWKWTIEDLIGEGDKVVVRMIGTGTHRGEFGTGIAPTGKPVNLGVVMIYRIAGGKIVEQWRTADDLGRLLQLGATIVPPGQPK